MPYLVDLVSRAISELSAKPAPGWYSVVVPIMRVSEGGLGPEYTPAQIRALRNQETTQLIVQDRDDAYDFEYWTREAVQLTMLPGGPSPIVF